MVIAGKDKGATGQGHRGPTRASNRVLVEGVNRIKKHTKVDTSAARRADRRHRHAGGADAREQRAGRLPEDGKRDPDRLPPQERTSRKVRDLAPCGEGTSDDCHDARPTPERPLPRLKQRYREEIAARPCARSSATPTSCRSPALVKIVVNMGVGEAARDAKLIEGAVRDLTAITGQKPRGRRARKSIAQFKLREGMPIGAHVTLRGDRMWEFLDRLLVARAAAHP